MKKFYITTSIAYTNAPPHIGFTLELIQADVLARYHRLLGENVFYLTGTDEHGRKVAEAAAENKKSPKKFSDEISTRFKELTKILNLSNNNFIRTTDKIRHWPVVKKVWLELKKNGDIYKKKYKGLYCSGCEAFITKKDLKDGKCILHKKKPEIIKEENYFFKLSRYSKQIEKAIEKNKIRIVPIVRKNEILSFIKKGLEDVSFSRPRKDLKWGIPVPEDNTQTIYVWADALINYLSVLSYPHGNNFKKYWPVDIHFLGKDILRFHATIWLGMLLSLRLPLPKNIFVHGFITSNGQKMSKSLGNVIDPFELVKKYGTDPLKYFLLREVPSTEDGDFTYQKFEERYNSDLAKGLGNLVARIITLAKKLKIKKEKLKVKNPKLKKEIDNTWKKYKKALEEFRFNEALKTIWGLIGFCDKYIEKNKPWSLDPAQDKEKINKVIADLLFALNEIVKLLKPFLPESSEKILKNIRQLAEKTKKSKPLFPRLT